MTTETQGLSEIRYPDPEHLDTEGWRSGDVLKLYLIPAGEEGSGAARIATHHSIGGNSWPMSAHHHRWVGIGSVRPDTVGESVLDALREIEGLLLAVSDAYRGAEWDGSNLVGRWDVPDHPGDDPRTALVDAWYDATSLYIRHYWDAGDWFGPAAQGWEELASAYGVDPTSILDDPDWERTVRDLARVIEADQDEAVTGTGDYLVYSAREYRAEHADEGVAI